MSEEESLISGFIRAIEGTKSTAEIEFKDLAVKIQGTSAAVVISGKVNFTAYPLQSKENEKA